MIKKHVVSIGLVVAMLLGSAFGFVGCGEPEQETHTHSLALVSKKEATCTEAGYEAYYKCSGCDKLFSDKEGKNEISAPEAIAAAHKIEAVAKQDATCTVEGYEAYYKCSVCNTLFSDAEGKHTITAAISIPVTAHTIVEVAKKRPTCTEAGYEEHYKCSVCNTLFSDEEGKTALAAPVAIPAAHRIVAVPKKDATCSAAGYEAHYKCSICDKLFSDETGKTEIASATVIPASGEHDFGFYYTSETLPAPVAEGGTIAAKCAHCDETQNISYDKGYTFTENQAVFDKLEIAGKHYGLYKPAGVGIAIRVNKPGTYTISAQNVLNLSEEPFKLTKLSISAYQDVNVMRCVIQSGTWNTLPPAASIVNKFKPKITIDFDEPEFSTISIKLEEGDVDFAAADGIWINMHFFAKGLEKGKLNGVLFTVETPA